MNESRELPSWWRYCRHFTAGIFPMNQSRLTYKGVMSHIWMSQESRHLDDDTAAILLQTFFQWMSHVSLVKESCLTYEWVKRVIILMTIPPPFYCRHMQRMNHVWHMNESCLTYEWVMSRIWMTQECHHLDDVPRRHFTAGICNKWVMPYIWMSHVSHRNESCLT